MKKLMQKTAAFFMAVSLLALCACAAPAGGNADGAVELPVENGAHIGQGAVSFTVEVTDREGKTVAFTVSSDEKTVGQALQTLGVLEGEEGPYGLFIKAVNGITADYDVDQTWWGFYVDGLASNVGSDMVNVTGGATYGFKVEK